mgnify:CR=1 FL=1
MVVIAITLVEQIISVVTVVAYTAIERFITFLFYYCLGCLLNSCGQQRVRALCTTMACHECIFILCKKDRNTVIFMKNV